MEMFQVRGSFIIRCWFWTVQGAGGLTNGLEKGKCVD
jgi:hypothetical protein